MKKIFFSLIILGVMATQGFPADTAMNAFTDGSASVASTWYLIGYNGTTPYRFTIGGALGLYTGTIGATGARVTKLWTADLGATTGTIDGTGGNAGFYLGKASTNLGTLYLYNNVGANPFTIFPGVTGVSVGWKLPTAMPTEASSTMVADTDGTIHYLTAAALKSALGIVDASSMTVSHIPYLNSSGALENLTVGTGLDLTAGTLTATGGADPGLIITTTGLTAGYPYYLSGSATLTPADATDATHLPSPAICVAISTTQCAKAGRYTMSNLTPGVQYVPAHSGGYPPTSTAPTASHNIIQKIGFAWSATVLEILPDLTMDEIL